MLVELMTAGLKPELVARVANACAQSYARGLIDSAPQRGKGAERQARYRERHAIPVTHSVTPGDVASRSEQASRVSLSPVPSIPSENKNISMRDSADARRSRGTRIFERWRPNEPDAKAEGLTELDIAREAARFHDYWKARAGSGGVKLDWEATWRNWCRIAAERLGRARPVADTPSGETMVFVSGNDPALAAWEAHLGRRVPRNKNGGWHFKTHWPPGHAEETAT